MTTQHSIQDTLGMVRIPDHDTSEQAADAALATRGAFKARILTLLREEGDRTDEELSDRLHQLGYRFAYSSPSKRRGDLYAEGLVTDSGLRRQNRNGRMMVVWHGLQDGELNLGSVR